GREAAAYLGETGTTSIDPCAGDLDYLTDYYWAVDEVNGLTTWSGQVWTFTSQARIIDPNNTLWYELNETEGFIAHDSSNFQNDGTVDIPEGGPPEWNPDGRWGSSLHFKDGTGLWVPTPVLSRVTDGVGVIFWANDPSNAVLHANGGDSQLLVRFEPVLLTWRAGNDSADVLTWDYDGGSLPEGWHCWAFIKDEVGDTISIYLDGELAEANGVATSTLAGVRNKPFKIGAETHMDGDFSGDVDDFIVYDRALSGNEVARQYYSGGPVGKVGQAWMPYPRDGATEVAREVVLGWKPGDYTVTRDVYMGTAWADVNDADTTTVGIFRGNQEANEYDPPGELEFDTIYYWRVDEINEPNIWKGRVWSFRSANFLVVDDMEFYSTIPGSGEEIYDTWDDGFVNWTGSQLALEYGSGAIVRSGGQSMKLGYNNSVAAFKYSEIDANTAGGQPGNLEIGKDWTILEAKSFTLFFYGQASNDSTEQLYAAVEDTPGHIVVVDYGVYGEDMNDIAEEEWHEFNIDLEDVNQAGVDIKDVNKVRIGFGDRDNPTVGGSGVVFFDDIRLYRLRCAPWIVKPVADLSDNCIVDWADVMMMAEHWLRTDFVLATVDPGTTGLVGHWTLDGDATDSSSYANHGTVTGDYTWVADHNDSLALALTEGICKVPDAAHLKPNSTVSAGVWFNYTARQSSAPRLVVKGGDNWESYCIELGRDRNITFYVGDTNGTRYFADSEEDVFDLGEWVHAAGTYDGSLVKCYVNGQVVGDNNEAVAIALSQDTNDLGIGNRPDDEERQFRGSVDEVRVYSRALSAAEVAWLATDGTGYVELTSPANLYDAEPVSEKAVNLRDFAVLVSSWLEKIYWP
ncbi:MAG: LamG domain-containing protein, partial [Planctomycetota bacterium]